VLGDAAEDRWLADGLADDLVATLGAWGRVPVVPGIPLHVPLAARVRPA